jgi:hypothetical protein
MSSTHASFTCKTKILLLLTKLLFKVVVFELKIPLIEAVFNLLLILFINVGIAIAVASTVTHTILQ